MNSNAVVVHKHAERIVCAVPGAIELVGHLLHVAQRGVGLVGQCHHVNLIQLASRCLEVSADIVGLFPKYDAGRFATTAYGMAVVPLQKESRLF